MKKSIFKTLLIALSVSISVPVISQSKQSQGDVECVKALAALALCALPILPVLADLHDQDQPGHWSRENLTAYFVGTSFITALGLSALYGNLTTFFQAISDRCHHHHCCHHSCGIFCWHSHYCC